MYLVGHITAPNGMATWCWEAAHALAEVGAPVALVADERATLPGTPAVEVIRTPSGRAAGRWRRELTRLQGPRTDVMAQAVEVVERRGETVEALLLNASALVLADPPAPQCVVAWAYPPTLTGYLRKVPLQAPLMSRAGVRATLAAIGGSGAIARASPRPTRSWRSRRNWRGALERRVPQVTVVAPGTHVADGRDADGARRDFLIVAANLEEPRKRVWWMLDALARQSDTTPVTLVGRASDDWRDEVSKRHPSASILPPCGREDLRALMSRHATLLFGSRFDDWGYVVTEAMGAGLAVVAPRQPPFTSIGEGFACFYEPRSPEDFAQAAARSLHVEDSLRKAAKDAVEQRYGRAAFGARLVATAEDAARRRARARSGDRQGCASPAPASPARPLRLL